MGIWLSAARSFRYRCPSGAHGTWICTGICAVPWRSKRDQGGAVTYSPVLDVVRDPRWGRTEECFGEDPYLISEYAVASVEGLQGDSLDSPSSVAATLKHFVGYGSSEGGRNAGPVHMGTRELMEVDIAVQESRGGRSGIHYAGL